MNKRMAICTKKEYFKKEAFLCLKWPFITNFVKATTILLFLMGNICSAEISSNIEPIKISEGVKTPVKVRFFCLNFDVLLTFLLPILSDTFVRYIVY